MHWVRTLHPCKMCQSVCQVTMPSGTCISVTVQGLSCSMICCLHINHRGNKKRGRQVERQTERERERGTGRRMASHVTINLQSGHPQRNQHDLKDRLVPCTRSPPTFTRRHKHMHKHTHTHARNRTHTHPHTFTDTLYLSISPEFSTFLYPSMPENTLKCVCKCACIGVTVYVYVSLSKSVCV